MNTKFYLILAIILVSFSTVKAQYDENDNYKKGTFQKAWVSDETYSVKQSIYSADAKTLATDWRSSGFTLVIQKGTNYFSTGKYAANANITAYGPSITLPKVSNGERIILQLDEQFKTETKYDYIYVRMSTDGGNTSKWIYRKSGKSGGLVSDYIDLTKYAGKSIQLSLQLLTDDSEQSDGWDISGISLYTAEKSNPSTGFLKSMLKSSSSDTTVSIISIDAEDYPDIVYVNFTVTGSDSNFVDSLTLSDIHFWDMDNDMNYGCLDLLEIDSLTVQQYLDIVFLVDNSGSMSDNYDKVEANIHDLLDTLAVSFNIQVGLMRYGQSTGETPVCPDYAVREDASVTSFFTRIDNTVHVTDFMDNIWSSNIDNGYYEPYYEVLNWAADEALNYRPNSQKVFIIIGDEGVSGANAQDCYSNASTLSDASVAAKLVDEGVQTFLIVDNSYESYFSLIASQTGGSTEDIDDDSYTDLLEHIAEKIEGKYILSYCLDTSATSYVDTSFRRVKIAMASDTAINDTMSYEVKETPYIIRTAATQALDPVAQTRLQEVTVSAKLYTQDSVESLSVCYMNYHDTVFNCVNGTIMSEDSTGIVFGTTIPAAVVDSPTVFYYFSATLYDQTTIRSSPPASTNEYEGWTFAVLPNYPPLIDSVTYDPGTDSVLPCAPITVCARITDTTAYVDKKILYYQVQATPSAYIPITMDSCTTCGASDWYCATIPAEAATETGMSYYIYAEDNYESQGWHGTPEAPLEISYTYTKTATTDSMRLYIMNYAYATMNCDALLSTDTIWAYFINTCGDLQKGGYGVWEGFGYINIILYGDSDASDGYKDGFEDDDDVYFTLERNGFNYQLELDHSITYYDGDFDMVSATAAANIPIMEISGNAEIIYPGTTTTSTIDDTNFGTCDTATTHTFTIENIGCADMYVYSISVSDTLNFSVNAITQQVIAEGLDYDFDVTYNATEDATALVRVYNNTSTTPYTFTVGGLLADTLPSCDDITLSPNPLASWGGNVSIPLTTQCTLTVSIYDTMGNLISSVFGPTTMAAGTHSIYVNASGLSSNTVYVLVVERGDETCGLQFTVQ